MSGVENDPRCERCGNGTFGARVCGVCLRASVEPVSAFTALQRLFRVLGDQQRAATDAYAQCGEPADGREAAVLADVLVLVREALESAEAYDALADDAAELER